jgi:hypothetical protein
MKREEELTKGLTMARPAGFHSTLKGDHFVVYTLNEDMKPFYVGRGKPDRPYRHLHGGSLNTALTERLYRLQRQGKCYDDIVRIHSTHTEKSEAITAERQLILLLSQEFPLMNKIGNPQALRGINPI